MILEVLAGAAAGLLGIVPFIHVNLLLQAFGPLFIPENSLAAFAVSLAISHSIIGLLPAVVFIAGAGAMGEGDGNYGGLLEVAFISLVVAIALLPLFSLLLPIMKRSMRLEMGLVFLAIIAAHFLSGKGSRERASGLAIFIVAGALGSITFFRSAVQEPLFPLLSGLYAIPALLVGKENGEIEGAGGESGAANRTEMIALAVFASALSTLFPALTPAVLMGVVGLVLGNRHAFSTAFPAIIVSKSFMDIAASAITGNTRSLAAVLALPLSGNGGAPGMMIIAAAGIASGGLAIILALVFSRKLRGLAELLGKRGARKAILAAILALIYVSGNAAALVIAGAASSLGILAHLLEARRSDLMGALVVPAMLFMFGLGEAAEKLIFG